MIFSSTVYLFFIGLLNILTTHTLLTRKKSKIFCAIAFTLTTLFIFIFNIWVKKYINNPEMVEYILYLISCSYLVYIDLVFEESIWKKIFAMFSIWMFSTICLVLAIGFARVFSGINSVEYILNIIYIIRIFIQVLLILSVYFLISKFYKKILNSVSNKTIIFMSLYPVLGFLLLINNYTISFERLKSFNSIWDMLLFLVFIILGYVLVFAGISSASQIMSLQYTMARLEWTSKTDSLTGLYNRRYIMERIENELISYKRNKKKFTLIIADIDFFKKINDTFGHDGGDRVLTVVSKSLQDAVREQDLISRWGGEEFLILLPETEIEGGHILANKLKKLIDEQIIDYNGVQMSITMTFGVTVNEEDEMIEDTIKKADTALYEGKSRGRNCVILS